MQRFKNILIVANDEGVSDAVIMRAKWLAHANGAALTLLAVKEASQFDLTWLVSRLPGQGTEPLGTRLDAVRAEDLEGIAETLRADGADVTVAVAEGVRFVEVIRRVVSAGHDLVLKGIDQSFEWRTFGGPDLHLLRKCPCPVWILNNSPAQAVQRIAAAVDPDPSDDVRDALGQKVMQLATSLAVQDSAKLDVLNAWYLPEEHLLRSGRAHTPPEDVEAILEETRSRSRARLDTLVTAYADVGPELNVLHIKGAPADVIVHHTEDQQVDTLIMGTVGRTGLPGMFIGNTAETVLSRVTCSVLAVKPEGFISPVTL